MPLPTKKGILKSTKKVSRNQPKNFEKVELGLKTHRATLEAYNMAKFMDPPLLTWLRDVYTMLFW